jgi:hypothetical protein
MNCIVIVQADNIRAQQEYRNVRMHMVNIRHTVLHISVIILVVFLTICSGSKTGNEWTQFNESSTDNRDTGSQDTPELPFPNRQFQPAHYSEPDAPVADGTLFFGSLHEYLYFLENGP